MSPFSVYTMDVKSPSHELFDSCDYPNFGARSDSGIDTEDQGCEDWESQSSSEGTNKLRAVGIQTLAELCVLCFRPDGSVNDSSSHFPRTLFLAHKWFICSELLAQEFFNLYRNAEKTVMCNPRKFFQKLTSAGDLQRKARADDQKPVYERIFRENLERIQISQRKSTEEEDAALRANIKLQARRKSWQKHSKEAKEETKRRESFSAVGRINSAFEKSVGRYGNGQTSEHDTCYRNGRHCSVCLYRRQVCHALRYWILQFPVHFSLDTKLANLLRDFSEYLSESQQLSLASLLDLSSLPSYDWVRNVSVRDPSVRHSRKVSLVFNHLEPNELAEHLTFLEHRIMRRISFQEYKQYAVSGSLSGTPRLERSVALFNGLTQWVQCMVLGRSTPQQRAEAIVKLVAVTKRRFVAGIHDENLIQAVHEKVSEKLLELRNYNSLMAVVGGLSHSSLARLTRTASCVPVEAQRDLAELAELLSSNSNFANYRRALHECKGFKIPILGIHLKDLISVNVAFEDFVDGELINFRKMQQLASVFQELQELQLTPPPDGANMDLVNTLRVSLDLAYSEDEIYELSLSREPRTFSPQCSPTRAHSSDWSSPCHIPSNIRTPVSKNLSPPSHLNCTPVRQFVKQRSDEYKSTKPLAPSRRCRSSSSSSASGMSHPAVVLTIPSTSVLASTFGNISPTQDFDDNESRSTESPVEMNHSFYETVCIKPALCAHCSGLLWGPIKQGFRCRSCGITAHGSCKEMVPSFCKPRKDQSSTHSDSDSGSSTKLRYRRKKKSVDSTHTSCTCEVQCCEPCKARPRMDRIHSISGSGISGLNFPETGSHPGRLCFKYQRPLSQYMNLSPKRVNLLPGSPMPARRKSSLVGSSQSHSFPESSSEPDCFRKKGQFRLFGHSAGSNVCTCEGHSSKL